MKKKLHKYSFLIILLFAIGCSTKKDAFLNRSFHAVNTKFNILYNGNIAFEKGVKELNDKYKDDYWKRLPIEPLKVEELALPGMTQDKDKSNASFEKAEEKAVKAVQKHGMHIKGRERNQQIDNAYLLLGKSRYYSQRFVPAIEAFNYVLNNYPNADLINDTKIWQAKTQLRLKNEDQALDMLSTLLKKEEMLDDEIKEKAHTAIAMVYTEMDSIDQTIHHLKQAVLTNNYKEQKARNLFILGQIYVEKNQIDSSHLAFDKIIKMKRIPYKYKIHSQIEKAKNISSNTDTIALIETLNKLIKDRENRPYLDALHYQLANVYQKLGQIDIAETEYKRSAHAKKAQKFQQGLSYEALGNIYFDKANFVDAGAYYDSVLNISRASKTKRIRRLRRKRENLEEVISFEGIRKTTDSILNVVAMNKEDQKLYFQTYIDKLKAAEEKAKEQSLNSGFGSFDDTTNQVSGNGKWYFYNTQAMGFGAQKFKQVWGNRPLEDNWRLSDKTIIEINPLAQQTEQVAAEETSKKYDINSYLERIPTETSVIDSIKTARNDAYYNLGLAYKEQFKVYPIAAERFEKLLKFSPEEKLVLPTKYHLFKIYSETNPSKALQYKTDITTNYADSKYAKLILNPQSILFDAADENSPENIYEKIYCDFEEKKYDQVITKTEKGIKQYQALEILPKYELLRAYAIGKKNGLKAFKEALEYVQLNYSNTEEGKKATEVIKTIDKLN